MAITATAKTTGGSTSNTTVYTTGTVTSPSSEKVYVVAVTGRNGGYPTLSGLNITWNAINQASYYSSPTWTISLFWGRSASPTEGTISITFAGGQEACAWGVVEIANANWTSFAVQSATNTTNSATGLTVTLGAFSDAGNATLGAFGSSSASTPMIGGGGFTVTNQSSIYDATENLIEFKSSNDTTVDVSRGTGTGTFGGVAIEINSAPNTSIKKVSGVTQSSIKKVSGVAIASVKKIAGLS